MNDRKRIVMGKVGLDSHDVGVRYVSRKLMENGFEVIFVQFYEPKELINIVIQEDADIVGVSFMTGSHMRLVEGIIEEMKRHHVDLPLIVGGIIPVQDHEVLKSMGVRQVFAAGSAVDEIVEAFQRAA